MNSAKKRPLFCTKIWTKKTMVFWQLSWSSFEYKKLVMELSKKVQKLTEAEQFVFIFEQSSQLSWNFLQNIYNIDWKREAGNSNQDFIHTATLLYRCLTLYICYSQWIAIKWCNIWCSKWEWPINTQNFSSKIIKSDKTTFDQEYLGSCFSHLSFF